MRSTALALLLLLAPSVAAQRCPWPEEGVPALAALVRTFEPALPRRTISRGVDPAWPHAEDLRYLVERGALRTLPADGQLNAVEWAEALAEVAAWTGATPPVPSADPQGWRDDVDALAAAVEAAVRPLALIAWGERDRRTLAFKALVWNYSAYPRLIVWRLGDDRTLAGPLSAVASTLGNCAFEVRDYVAAAEPIARSLFTRENQAVMYIVGSEPDLRDRWPIEVPAGEETAIFAFEHPLLEGVDAFSAVFVGEAPPLLTFLRLLPRVRTSLWPTTVPYYLATPPRAP